MIRVLPKRIRADATALVALVGVAPDLAVDWSATSGTITPLTTVTDAQGRAFARWTPSAEGAATITAAYGGNA